MNRQTLIAAAALALLVIGAGYILTGPKPGPVEEIAKTEEPAPKPVPRAAPKADPPKPATEPARRATPKAAPVDAAPPVEAAPEGGTLSIDSDVRGAQVFIDREYVGVTPLKASGITPGSHRINLSAQGYEGLAESIDVEPGPRDLMFKFKEVRLDLALDVVHKHRMGSCKGRLIATTKGLRYETPDKDDAFTLPLAELETFQVDYLEKNLRIAAKKGKRYDFTDPEGNADHLFVFHRDVEKARERIIKGDQPAQ